MIYHSVFFFFVCIIRSLLTNIHILASIIVFFLVFLYDMPGVALVKFIEPLCSSVAHLSLIRGDYVYEKIVKSQYKEISIW